MLPTEPAGILTGSKPSVVLIAVHHQHVEVFMGRVQHNASWLLHFLSPFEQKGKTNVHFLCFLWPFSTNFTDIQVSLPHKKPTFPIEDTIFPVAKYFFIVISLLFNMYIFSCARFAGADKRLTTERTTH